MMFRFLFILVLVLHATHFTSAQSNFPDSCGVDAKPELNRYEIAIVDSLFLPPLETKKYGTIDRKNGFDFKNKRVLFYSCTKESNKEGDGWLSKNEFFEMAKTSFKGHAGRGIIVFNEKEKVEAKGYDAVLIVDCLIVSPKMKESIVESIQKLK